MIELTKFIGASFWVNPDLIQTIEASPDTRLLLTTTLVLMVQEEPVVIAQKIVDYRRTLREERVHAQAPFRLIQFAEDQ
ncbi:MAG: flagellar protein FlbD [Chloroflexi bacterium]|nr:MAG: flagellar protein FlbD [Chloroflexota bacterium]